MPAVEEMSSAVVPVSPPVLEKQGEEKVASKDNGAANGHKGKWI